jgi:hypothetical protein
MQGETLPPQVEEGSVRRAAKAYEDMSRKFGDTPPQPDAPVDTPEPGEFTLSEAPPTPPPLVRKPGRDEE